MSSDIFINKIMYIYKISVWNLDWIVLIFKSNMIQSNKKFWISFPVLGLFSWMESIHEHFKDILIA